MARVLAWIVGTDLARDIYGDLLEERLRRVDRSHVWAALWFWASAVTIAAVFAVGQIKDSIRGPWRRGLRRRGGGAKLRQAVRSLRARPVISGAAVLSLAFSIGAATAVFSLIDSVFLQPLAVSEPSALAVVASARADGETMSFPYRVWTELRDRGILTNAFAWSWVQFNATTSGPVDRIDGMWATGNVFQVLGLKTALGRPFTEADDKPGGGPAGPVAVISSALWKQRFGGAPDVIGRPLALEGLTFTIIGVAPASWRGLDIGLRSDVIVPMQTSVRPDASGSQAADVPSMYVEMMERRARGRSRAQLTANLQAAQPAIRDATMPRFDFEEDRRAYLAEPWIAMDGTTGVAFLKRRYEHPLQVLFAVAALLVLIACANIAYLLIARTADGRAEFALRAALGASRLQIVKQLTMESALLAGTGAAAGFLFSQVASRTIVSALSTQAYTVTLNLSPDWRVFAFTTAIGALTTLLFGVGPAFRAVRVSAAEVLRTSTSRISAGRAPGGSVLVAQVAMTITLVVIGGLLGQTFLTLARVDPGFDREGSMIVTIDTARSTISPAVRGELFGRAADAVAAVPGVVAAAASQTMPSGSFRSTPLVEVPGAPPMSPDNRFLYGNAITPGWFHTLGIGFVAGRDFNARDQQGTAPVAIVNAAFVHRFYQEPNVVGKTIFRLRGQPARREPLEIVGVVNDAIYQSVREPAPPTLFIPVAQAGSQPLPTFSLTVRSADGQPERLTKSVADALAALDPTLIFSFRSLADQIDSAFRQEQLLAALSAFFGALALVLAALGMYGVTSYGVARRRFEIGVRMALGASRASVMRLVIGRVAMLATLGVALGALFSALVTQFIAALLLGVSARDLSTFVAAAAVVLSASALAVWRPALRAASVDAAKVLRDG